MYFCVFEENITVKNKIDCYGRDGKYECPMAEICDCSDEMAEKFLERIKECVDIAVKVLESEGE